MQEETGNSIFSSKYKEDSEEHQGVWNVLTTSPNFQGYQRSTKKVRFERRIVDYFFEKLYEEKDSHRHWCVVVKYGSKTFYVDTTIEKFSNWFFSDSILVEGGHAWEYKGRLAKHAKYRNRPKQ